MPMISLIFLNQNFIFISIQHRLFLPYGRDDFNPLKFNCSNPIESIYNLVKGIDFKCLSQLYQHKIQSVLLEANLDIEIFFQQNETFQGKMSNVKVQSK